MADTIRTQPRSPVDPAGPIPDDRNMGSAQRLIDAVLCLLVEDGTGLLAAALTPEQVARRAGMSRSTYYRVDAQSAVPRDRAGRRKVLEAAMRTVLDASAGDVEQVAGALDAFVRSDEAAVSPQELIRSVTSENLASMEHFWFQTQIFAAALSTSSPRIAAALGSYYDTVTERYTEAYEEAIRHIGYRVRSPFTVADFTLAMMAMAEGLAMRRLGDRTLDIERCVDQMESIVNAYLVRVGDLADPTGLMHQPPVLSTVAPTRTSILEAAAHLFAQERASVPTIDEIAVAANCSDSTIRHLFGGVVGVVRAAWDEWTPEFHEVVDRNRRALHHPDPLTVLYRVALAVAARAAEQRALTRAMLISEIGIEAGSADHVAQPEPISSLFEQLLREAQHQGVLAAPGASDDSSDAERLFLLARALRNNLLNLVVSAPVAQGNDATAHARWCVDYVWALVMAGRDAPTPAGPT